MLKGVSPFSCGAVFFNSASFMPKAWTGNVCPQPRDFAAYPSRLKDEPRQGFISVQFFEHGKPLFGYCFSSGDEGLFCDTIFPKKPLCPLPEKDARWQAFIRVPFFKRKAVVIVCFEMCRDGFYKSTIFLQLNTEIRRTVKKKDCLFIFKNTIKEFCHMDTMIRAP